MTFQAEKHVVTQNVCISHCLYTAENIYTVHVETRL